MPATKSTFPQQTIRRKYIQSLELRPLLWIAPAAMIGAVLGVRWGEPSHPLAHLSPNFVLSWLPFIAAVIFVILCVGCVRKKYFWGARIAVALAIIAGFCGYGFRRVTPPPNNISRLVSNAELTAITTPAALKATPILVRGYVAASPRVTDYNQGFPLKSTFVRSNNETRTERGNIWIQTPLETSFTAGDFVEIRANLRDLQRTGTPTESVQIWRYIRNNCWSMARLQKNDSIKVLLRAEDSAIWQNRAHAKLGKIRQHLLEKYQSQFLKYHIAFPRSSAQLMVGMVYGNRALNRPLPSLVRNHFRDAGLVHLLVASGTHVGFLMLMIIGFLRVLGLRRFPRIMFALLLIPLLAYAFLSGGASSIWRASIAGACIGFALLWGRPIDALSLWSLAAIVLLLIDPLQIFDLSFQLTFAATWGLIVLAPHLINHWKKYFGTGVATTFLSAGIYTLSAQLAISPFLIYHFDYLSLAGLLTNFVGLPLAGILVGSGILSLAIPPLTYISGSVTHLMFNLATYASTWNALQLRDFHFSVGWICAYYILLFGITRGEELRLIVEEEWQHFKHWRARRGMGESWMRIMAWAFVAIALIWSGIFLSRRPAELKITFLDVGQGDAIFIQTPHKYHFLIDGGTLNGTEHGKIADSVIIPYLQSQGVRQLDGIFLSHTDADHFNALEDVIEEIPTKLFLDGGGKLLPSGKAKEIEAAQVDYQSLQDAIAAQEIPHRLPHGGQIIRLDDGVILQVIAPLRPVAQNENNSSMVIKLIYGNMSFLFTGDMEKEEEMQLIHRGANLQSTILKVGHHGSKTSSSEEFLQAVNPAAAVISCGRYNPFGHPAAAVLERFKENKIQLYRTDLSGTIEVRSDGKQYVIDTFR